LNDFRKDECKKKISCDYKRVASIAAGWFFPDSIYGFSRQHCLTAIGQDLAYRSDVRLECHDLFTDCRCFSRAAWKSRQISTVAGAFLIGILIFTISSILCGISGSIAMLIAMRILQGIGSPMIFGTGVAILTSVYPSGEKGKALGINTAATYLGLSAGPFFGGFLTHQFGWRSIFFTSAAMGLIALILVAWKLRGEWAEACNEHYDWIGAAIYSSTLIAMMYGISRLPSVHGFV
jgi:MFS family permease